MWWQVCNLPNRTGKLQTCRHILIQPRSCPCGPHKSPKKKTEKTPFACRQIASIPGYIPMGPVMTENASEPDDLLRRAQAGDEPALAALFAHYRERLKRLVQLRLDRRLSGRVDASDVLQEAYLEVHKRFPEYARETALPFYLWLRLVTGQKLTDVHRHHLGTQMRDAGQEISLYRGALPQATSASLAAQLLGRITSASQAAIRAEHKILVQEALNSMDPLDREVLVLRHFEHLNNEETAQVLGVKKSTASQRYIRALKRLKDILSSIPGLKDNW
jgi:RNA polymerase sigma-70 factor (ECF subfamily)